MIPENRYLFRAPLLDPKQHVIGYRLAWQKNGPGSDISDAADSQQLLAFVVGMFSFLDHLLGIPIQEVLSQLVLPEPVVQALRSREGVYGQVLALAEASEREGGGAADFAEALSRTATQVNQAHLSALAWVQNIKL